MRTSQLRSDVVCSVVRDMRLSDGSAAGKLWPIPVTLDLNVKQLNAANAAWNAAGSTASKRLSLKDGEGNTLAVLDVEEMWKVRALHCTTTPNPLHL